MLGCNWERKFGSKCKNANAKKPEEWERLREFLNTELAIVKNSVSWTKVKSVLELSGFGSGVKGNKFANTASGTNDRMKCHICESNHHVVTPNGNARRCPLLCL